jgi:hypothetical protein
MDWTAIGASVVTMVLGIAAVSKFLGKVLPQVTKYTKIAADALGLIDDVLDAIKDGTISADEVTKIKAAAETLKADFKV